MRITKEGNVGINSAAPTATLDVLGDVKITGIVTASSFESTVATGTAPFTVASTTLVTNLNADLLDGKSTANSKVGNTIVTRNAAGGFVAGDVTFDNIVGAAATFNGNVSIAGTLTYEDVTNIDSIGIITARDGINVSGGGINVTGVSTFNSDLNISSSVPQILLTDTDNDSDYAIRNANGVFEIKDTTNNSSQN